MSIPTHHTKLIIAHPHPIGLVNPQIRFLPRLDIQWTPTAALIEHLPATLTNTMLLGWDAGLRRSLDVLAKIMVPLYESWFGIILVFTHINAIVGAEMDTGYSFHFSDPSLYGFINQ